MKFSRWFASPSDDFGRPDPDRPYIPAAITIDPGDPSLFVLAYFAPGSPPEPFPVGEQKPEVIEPTAIYFRRNTRLFYYETLEIDHGLDPRRLVQDGNGSASEGTREGP